MLLGRRKQKRPSRRWVCLLVRSDACRAAAVQNVVARATNAGMHIITSSGNVYSYLRQTNEIVAGEADDSAIEWNFAPIVQFTSMPGIDSFILGVTEQCNLRCAYCCYSGSYAGNRTHGVRSMSASDIDSVYDFIDEQAPGRSIRISFYGGEPLTDFSLVQYAVERGYGRWGDKVTFSISTNGVLLRPEVCDWIIANKVELAVSVDGTERYHDRNRVDVSGMGSFSRIYRALEYIKERYPQYFRSITVLMTSSSSDDICQIAEDWHNDPLLREISPAMINGLAPNFSVGVRTVEYEDLKEKYTRWLDLYQQHPDWNILKVFFNQCIAYWKDRPILAPEGTVPMATCLPHNSKLYIDSSLNIGVCEKISDSYRIGNVRTGVDWGKANSVVEEYYSKRVDRCRFCPAVRMCDMCLTAVEHNCQEWDILCHNERVYTRLYMYLFCEMAERGLLQ